jgi:uncharacterized membrane protein
MNLSGGAEWTAAAAAAAVEPQSAPASIPTTAEAFRGLVAAVEQAKEDKSAEAARAADLERRRKIKALVQQHLDDEMWRTRIDHAREAAAVGKKEFQLLRFPSGLCSDDGRKIDVSEADWGTTLRGEAADLYAR